jgi:hypothetical protein
MIPVVIDYFPVGRGERRRAGEGIVGLSWTMPVKK